MSTPGGFSKRRFRTRLVATLAATAAAVAVISGCQINYIMKSAVSQAELLMKRVPIDEALNDSSIPEESKRKLRLAQDARRFAERELGLKSTLNYTSYVQLDRPYVTYVVSAAPRTELTHHLWKYPIVGSMPYRGYFNEADARKEAASLEASGLDAYVRGVSAYSTLGWFQDPILSSMLAYQDHDLVNTIIHETVHATIFIRSEADFNERLATFIGNIGTERYYLNVEGPASPTLQLIRAENNDDKLFSEFISGELNELTEWYAERKGQTIPEDQRKARLEQIRARFNESVKPRLAPGNYRAFEKGDINNARLLTYKLYFEDLTDFERVYQSMGSDLTAFLAFCKSLEDEKDPAKALADRAASGPK